MLLTLVMFRRKSERQGSIRVTGVCKPENTLTVGVFVYFHFAFELHSTFIFKMHFYLSKLSFKLALLYLDLNACNSSDARLNSMCAFRLAIFTFKT